MSESGFNLFQAIIKPLRDADETGLLQRFMEGPQAIHDQAEDAILSLMDQIKASEVREDLLQYLMPLVGFTSELRNITDRLTTEQLRRLVNMAVPLWDARHTKAGLVNAIRLLTGRAALYSDWFTYRAMLGEVSLTEDQLSSGGDFWLIGGSITTYDEYWSNIRVMDDGTLDELLLLDVCKLMRPMDERFEVFIDDFLDYFDGVLDKWYNFDGGSVAANGSIVDVVTTSYTTRALELVAGGSLAPVVPILAAATDHHDYNIAFKFMRPIAGTCGVRFYTDASLLGNGYEVLIDADGLGSLVRWDSGVATIIQGPGDWPADCAVAPDVWYALRISVVNVDANTRAIRVLIDGNQACPPIADGTEILDAPGPTPAYGPYLFNNYGASPMWLDNVESWRNPARFATIGLSTIADRGGTVVMSDNFIE